MHSRAHLHEEESLATGLIFVRPPLFLQAPVKNSVCSSTKIDLRRRRRGEGTKSRTEAVRGKRSHLKRRGGCVGHDSVEAVLVTVVRTSQWSLTDTKFSLNSNLFLQHDEWWEQPAASTVVDWVAVDGQNVAVGA
ncbi:hypothetical protein SESBI_43636 [Sesbania bispinosa]|nr:hypothetical protein SESBI_43636 [Sesbania bispinosa]